MGDRAKRKAAAGVMRRYLIFAADGSSDYQYAPTPEIALRQFREHFTDHEVLGVVRSDVVIQPRTGGPQWYVVIGAAVRQSRRAKTGGKGR